MKNKRKHIALLFKYLSGKTDKQENFFIEDWKNRDKESQNSFEQYQKLWNLLDKVNSQTLIDTEKEWKKFKEKLEVSNVYTLKKSILYKPFFNLYKVAAFIFCIVLLGVLIYYYVQQHQYTRIIAQSQTVESILPDGSIVTLNINSVLRTPKRFATKNREVKLSGEAFFNVKHIDNKPFIIYTKNLIIKVAGTSFYINDKQGSDIAEVIVNTGKVIVASTHDKSMQIVLQQGNKGIFYKSSNKLLKTTNIDKNYLAWKTKYIEFNNHELSYIVKILSRVYNKQIIIKDKKIEHYRITATFDNQSLEAILNVLKATIDIKIIKEKDKIIISE